MIPVGTGSMTRPGAGGDHTGERMARREVRAMGKQIYGYSPAEHEYSVSVPKTSWRGIGSDEVTIYVSAHGGGTVGEEYAGNGWDYLVTSDGRPVLEGSDLRSAEGRAAGHAEMVRTLASFLSAAGESMAHSDTSEYASEYTADEAEWLAAEYERLGLFAAGE